MKPARKKPLTITGADGLLTNKEILPRSSRKSAMKKAPPRSRKQVMVAALKPINFEKTPIVAMSMAEVIAKTALLQYFGAGIDMKKKASEK
jgi:hypothetical protein